MREKLILLTIPAVIVLLLGAAPKTHAMSAYARNFDMKCGDCHKQRIPELNEFGIAFYKNGFALPGENQEKPAAATQEAQIPGTAASPSDTPDSKPAEGGGMPDQKAEESKPAPPPEVPLVIYQGQAGDGSVYYTDNPLSRRRLQDKGRTAAPSAGEQKVVTRTPKKKDTVTPPKKEAAKRYRTYQECMERHLENAPPGSAQAMMELFMEAERNCAAYPSRNP